MKVQEIPSIKKIACGANHTLAVGQGTFSRLKADGVLYGWGSNSQMQLSHSVEFSQAAEPLIAAYQPLRIQTGLENSTVTDVAGGENFTIAVTKNKRNFPRFIAVTSETEVFGTGFNSHGQLGAGFVRHISDVVKIEGLSNYKNYTAKGQEDVTIKQLSCGDNHCMALLSLGAVLEWGANEYGIWRNF
jgi:alpha-tubulin suppressor-like RCC1 family protein